MSVSRVAGKTTVGRTILHLYKPTAGEVWYDGRLIKNQSDIKSSAKGDYGFQDPYSSLNPRMTVSDIIGEPLTFIGCIREKKKGRKKFLSLWDEWGLTVNTHHDMLMNFPAVSVSESVLQELSQ